MWVEIQEEIKSFDIQNKILTFEIKSSIIIKRKFEYRNIFEKGCDNGYKIYKRFGYPYARL